MRHRSFALLFALAFFLTAASSASVVAGSSEFLYKKSGDHWYHPSDRGYFKIFSARDEPALTVRRDPSPESAAVKQLRRGDIVVSDGITHWGGAFNWQKISSGSEAGWIPQRNLIRARPRVLGASTIPVAGSCSGHTPPWGASWSDKLVRVSLFPGRAEIAISEVLAAQEPRISMLTGSTSEIAVDLVVTSEACALVQGQSPVGVTGTLIVTDQSGKRLLSGCCQADPAAF